MNKFTQLGFTLAEVLITLLIIGVISSLVIPALINNINEQQNKVAWKKAFANFAQVTAQLSLENGGDIGSTCMSNTTYGTDYRHCFKDLYQSKFNYVKACDAGCGSTESDSFYGNCWANQGKFYLLNGTPHTDPDCRAGFILNDGTFIGIREGWTGTPAVDGLIPRAWIDVNGFKPPNTVGKDIFAVFTKNKSGSAIPCENHELKDCPTDPSTCNPSGNGWGCSAVYLYQ